MAQTLSSIYSTAASATSTILNSAWCIPTVLGVGALSFAAYKYFSKAAPSCTVHILGRTITNKDGQSSYYTLPYTNSSIEMTKEDYDRLLDMQKSIDSTTFSASNDDELGAFLRGLTKDLQTILGNRVQVCSSNYDTNEEMDQQAQALEEKGHKKIA